MGYTALIVDDEEKWRKRCSQLLPEQLIEEIQIASTPDEASAALQRRRFDVVLLDLCMDASNHADRSNEEIQKYLASAPEQTVYIVVSSNAERMDARDALQHYGAAAVVFKDEIEQHGDLLAQTVDSVLARLPRGLHQTRVHDAARALLGSQTNEHNLMTTLGLHGANELYLLGDRLVRHTAPIAHHLTRPVLQPTAGGALGLFWSRGTGFPLGVSITSSPADDGQMAESLSAWLGFEVGEVHEEFTFGSAIQVKTFRLDPGLEATFSLPTVKA